MAKKNKKRKNNFQKLVVIIPLILLGLGGFTAYEFSTSKEQAKDSAAIQEPNDNQSANPTVSDVKAILDSLEVKGRAPKTGYEREQFTSGWAEVDGCDMRNIILQRDLKNISLDNDNCTVLSGTLQDPYTDKQITFKYGVDTSGDVQIDHVVALGDAWQKGAQDLDISMRVEFSNDPLNLLAVDGTTNASKGDSDAASWLPPHKAFRCTYIAMQVLVKDRYALWVTSAEHDAMESVLSGCQDQDIELPQ